MSSGPIASVVIPAHNEAGLIGGNLRQLLEGAKPDEFDVIVVCNGCSDDTASIARRSGARVVEIDVASKVAALNAGDDAAGSLFPRVYLDADVAIEADALRAVAEALADGAPAAAPLPLVETEGCGWVSRHYFAIWSRLGYARKAFVGSGCYGMSAAGRSRFGRFPALISDDGFVYAAFTAEERVNPPGAFFRIMAPRTARALFRRRIRISAGNLELERAVDSVPAPPGPYWSDVARRDRGLVASSAVYAGINAVAKMAALRRVRSGTAGAWHTDLTVRQHS